MKQEKTIIFKASDYFDKTLKLEAKKRNTTKSGLIKACVVKVLKIEEPI